MHKNAFSGRFLLFFIELFSSNKIILCKNEVVMRIGTKITLAIIFAVVLSVGGITVTVNYEVKEALTNQFKISAESQVKQMASFVNLYLNSARSNAESIASSKAFNETIEDISVYVDIPGGIKTKGADLPEKENNLYNELQNMQNNFSDYFLVYVANHKGGITQAPDDILSEGYDPSKRPWYLDAKAARKTIVTDAYLSDSNEVVTTVVAPVFQGSNMIGAAAIDFALSTINKEVGSAKIGKTGYMILINPFGQFISAQTRGSEGDWLGRTFDDLPKELVSDLEKACMVSDHTVHLSSISFDGAEWLIDVYQDDDGWVYAMLQEESEVFADAMEITLSILLIGFLLIAGLAVFAIFLSRSIAKPVETLANASNAVANGNLNAIPVNSAPFKGELGLLHKSLLEMVAKLTELISTANDKIKEAEEALENSKKSFKEAEEAKIKGEKAKKEGILQAAEQINIVFERLNDSAKKLLTEIETSSSLTNSQKARVNQINSSINEMNSVVSEVALSSSRTANLAEDTFSEAQQGRKFMGDVITNMSQIQEQSLSMRQSLESLGSQAESIDVIMNVISDIADQTNLLALNAAIEAARAGEAGRGFAVVADEVRKLAEKTMEATKQVNMAITNIQESTHENMNAMRDAAEFINQSAGVVDDASVSLTNIEQLADNTAGEIRSIAAASEEQAQTSIEIKNNIEDMTSATQELAEGEQRAEQAVIDLIEASKALAKVIEDLRSGNL